jgi:hypothetical protein
MMQKSSTFTTIFRVKNCYFHYDFVCKKVLLSLRYAKKVNFITIRPVASANLAKLCGVSCALFECP